MFNHFETCSFTIWLFNCTIPEKSSFPQRAQASFFLCFVIMCLFMASPGWSFLWHFLHFSVLFCTLLWYETCLCNLFSDTNQISHGWHLRFLSLSCELFMCSLILFEVVDLKLQRRQDNFDSLWVDKWRLSFVRFLNDFGQIVHRKRGRDALSWATFTWTFRFLLCLNCLGHDLHGYFSMAFTLSLSSFLPPSLELEWYTGQQFPPPSCK